MRPAVYAGICFIITIYSASGQSLTSSVLATDGQTIIAHGAISYTIGETMVRTFDKYGFTLEEGFQRVTGTSDIALDTTITESVHVAEISVETTISCFPNPAVNVITISNNTSSVVFENGAIFDICGNKVYEFELGNANDIQIDITTFPSGQYLVYMKDADSNVSVKELFTILK